MALKIAVLPGEGIGKEKVGSAAVGDAMVKALTALR